MAAAAGEHRLQMRILFALSLLGALIALGFSQSAALFNPPSIIAAGAQIPTQPDGGVTGGGGVGGEFPGARGPSSVARNFLPRTPGTTGSGSRNNVIDDDGLGGPIETADATGAVPPSIAQDLATPPTSAAPSSSTGAGGDGGGSTGPGSGGPGIGGPGAGGPGGSAPGAGTDPVAPPPTTPVPEPATWLVLIVGVAIVGGALRRRLAALDNVGLARA